MCLFHDSIFTICTMVSVGFLCSQARAMRQGYLCICNKLKHYEGMSVLFSFIYPTRMVYMLRVQCVSCHSQACLPAFVACSTKNVSDESRGAGLGMRLYTYIHVGITP